MTTQLYTYEYRKPRLNNPTFLSSNVASSLSFYNPRKISPESKNTFSNQQGSANRYDNFGSKDQSLNVNMKPSKSDFSLPKVTRDPQKAEYSLNYDNSRRQNPNQLGKYAQNILNSSTDLSNIEKPQQQSYKRGSSLQNLPKKDLPQQNKSPLINLGEKEIFMKQGHNYNIITYKPKQYNEYIKKYPKLSLQEKDQYFRLKYINDAKLNKSIFENRHNPEDTKAQTPNTPVKDYYKDNKADHDEKMAGMHTYRINGTKQGLRVLEKPQTQRKQTALQLSDKGKPNPRSNQFNMKLLNHMDQLNYFVR